MAVGMRALELNKFSDYLIIGLLGIFPERIEVYDGIVLYPDGFPVRFLFVFNHGIY